MKTVNMGHSKLAEKLDAIQENELGVPFDDELIWGRISEGLVVGGQESVFEKRYLLAACLMLLVLVLPMHSLREKTDVVQGKEIAEIETAETITASEGSQVKTPERTTGRIEPLALVPLQVDLGVTAQAFFKAPVLEPIDIKVHTTEDANHFAANDVSAIQATLQKSEEKNKLKVSVKMELYTSSKGPSESETELKLRINGRN